MTKAEKKEYNRKYYEANKEKLKANMRAYDAANKEAHLARSEAWIEENREKHNDNQKKSFQKNKGKRADYARNRRHTDIQYRLAGNLRARLGMALKRNYKSGSVVRDLGCSIEELKVYLEQRFTPGMTWDNYGDWHIDHIKPLDAFDLTTELRLACHYTNLQPLWAVENIVKGSAQGG